MLALLGGLGTTTAIWRRQLDAVDGAVAFDLPGHGAEPLPDGEVTIAVIGASLLERLPERFSFCGISLGGMVGMWIAAIAPDRVERLVLACTGAKLGERADYEARAELVRSEGIGVVVEGARDRWFTPAFRESPEARMVLDALATMDPEGYAACCEAVGRFDFRGELGSVRAPTLALFGDRDPVTPPEVRETLLRGIPGVRTAEIREAAHLANVQQPEAFTDHLRSAA
ncbi:MAG TPA: alpha/beta fold hydrolase [Gaiellaceae bacterium]|nr:alpha/beta fold hydrolase [Gaiellaceae bacterium]